MVLEWIWLAGGGCRAVTGTIKRRPGADVTIRLAGLEDAQAAAQLEAEHWQHYTRPPVLMRANPPDDASALREMLNQPGNTLWLAEWRGEPVGMLRLETHRHGAADIVQAEGVAAITGLYVRPQARGLGAAAAMLDAALAHYRALDYKCCSVDFEFVRIQLPPHFG